MKRPRIALLGLVAAAGFLVAPVTAQAGVAQPQAAAAPSRTVAAASHSGLINRAAAGRLESGAVSAPCTGWSSTTPSQCGQASQAVRSHMAPAWLNDAGCGGYFTGSNPKEMQCRGVAITVNNFPVAIRYGYWQPGNPDVPDGFGWSKAYYYHNLWMQPMLDTISGAVTPRGANNDREYEVYHYNPDGYVDQEVIVVADIQDPYFAGTSTQDHKAVGVITGYCLTGAGAEEPTCPEWVDSTL